ncbi:MAG: hypothetical protein FWC47_16485 [Oscillospiraceae bacterium]|nr:hypothetical protein [Oscillospiraceae bacterium]
MVYIKFVGPFSKLMPSTTENGYFASDSGGKSISSCLSSFDFGNITYVILVNNMREDKDYILQDGDKLLVMPTLAGG